MLRYLATGQRTRDEIMTQFGLDVRGFYRDMEKLRESGILITVREHCYSLTKPYSKIVGKLPIPDPQLTFREAKCLADGKSDAHKKLRHLLREISSPGGKR
jgi:predicted DNA-binding transcriptional regulator YafY